MSSCIYNLRRYLEERRQTKKMLLIEKRRFCTVVIKHVSIEDIAAIKDLLDKRRSSL